MSNFRGLGSASIVVVCLAFTGAGVAWADPSTADRLVPAAHPHAEFGSTVRVGTAVGFIYGAPDNTLAVGLTAAVGQRLGRLGIEAEYTYLAFEGTGTVMTALGPEDTDVQIGSGHRLDLMARFDVLRFGPTTDGNRSLVTLYAEGGAGTAWNSWSRPGYDDTGRIIPDNTRRTEGQAGFGVMIFPHRVAWLLGWRFAFSPHQAATGTSCRGTSCRSVVMTDSSRYIDDSMLFQSSLEFTF